MSQTGIKKKLKQFTSNLKQKKKNYKIQQKLKKVDLNYDYDEDADVLYASVGEPKPAESIDYDDGVVLRLDPYSKEYIGFTIINYMDRKKQGKLKKIPHFKGIELPNY